MYSGINPMLLASFQYINEPQLNVYEITFISRLNALDYTKIRS